MDFVLTPQAKKLIEKYGLEEEKVKDWQKQRSRQIGGEQILDYMVEQAEE